MLHQKRGTSWSQISPFKINKHYPLLQILFTSTAHSTFGYCWGKNTGTETYEYNWCNRETWVGWFISVAWKRWLLEFKAWWWPIQRHCETLWWVGIKFVGWNLLNFDDDDAKQLIQQIECPFSMIYPLLCSSLETR